MGPLLWTGIPKVGGGDRAEPGRAGARFLRVPNCLPTPASSSTQVVPGRLGYLPLSLFPEGPLVLGVDSDMRGSLGHHTNSWAPAGCAAVVAGGSLPQAAEEHVSCGPVARLGSLSPAGHPRGLLSARQPCDSACVLLKLMELVKTEVPLFIFPLLNKNVLNIYSLLSQFLLTSASGFSFLAVGRRGEGSGLLADFRLWRTSA